MKVPTLPSTVDAIVSERSSSGDRRSDANSRSFPESLLEVRNSRDREKIERQDSASQRRDSEIEDKVTDSRDAAEEVSESPRDSSESTDLEAEQVTQVANATRTAAGESFEPQQGKQNPSESKTVTGVAQISQDTKESAPQKAEPAMQRLPGHPPLNSKKGAVTATSELSTGGSVTTEIGGVEGEKALAATPRGTTQAEGLKGISTVVSPLAGLSAAGKQSWFESNQDGNGGASSSSFHILGRTTQQSLSEGPPPAYSTAEAEVAAPKQPVSNEGTFDSSSRPNPSSALSVRSDGMKLDAPTAAPPEVIQAESVEPPELARRIYRLVRRSLARGDHQLKIRLDPPRMGRVDVDFRIAEEQMGIRFTVETEEVREILRSHLDELHRSLEEHGWNTNSVEVDLRPADQDAGQGESASSEANSGEEKNELEEVEDIRELRLWHLGKAVDLRG